MAFPRDRDASCTSTSRESHRRQWDSDNGSGLFALAAGMAGMPIKRIRPVDIDIRTTSFSLTEGIDLPGSSARPRLAATRQ